MIYSVATGCSITVYLNRQMWERYSSSPASHPTLSKKANRLISQKCQTIHLAFDIPYARTNLGRTSFRCYSPFKWKMPSSQSLLFPLGILKFYCLMFFMTDVFIHSTFQLLFAGGVGVWCCSGSQVSRKKEILISTRLPDQIKFLITKKCNVRWKKNWKTLLPLLFP